MLRFIRHALALIREDKLFSTIYIAGTAVAIASAMVIAIVFNMMLGDIPPEVNRSRTLYVSNRFIPGEKSDDVPYHQGLSSVALDSCYRRMKCVEAATGPDGVRGGGDGHHTRHAEQLHYRGRRAAETGPV